MKKVRFVVINRPKIGVDGRMDVVLDVNGDITKMGYVLQTRNSGVYRAYDPDGKLVGEKSTRSQAGHLLQRGTEQRSAKRVLPHAVAAAPAAVATDDV